MSIKNNTIPLQELLKSVNNLPNAATPVISVNSATGRITATAGNKFSQYQLAFQPAKTITPSNVDQVVASSGYYTGGDIIVAAVPTQVKSVTPKATAQDVFPNDGKFLSKVIINGDNNLIAENIKSGVNIFGVDGTLEDPDLLWDQIISRELVEANHNTVKKIGSYAFAGCPSLITADFPVATTIGLAAFKNCFKLNTINFPMVTLIESEAFYSCNSLISANFPEVTQIKTGAFQSCLQLTTANFSKATIIGNSAFEGCRYLTTISFPSVTEIGSRAFDSCRSLTTISFPSVTEIGSRAFDYCSALTTINFPALQIATDYAFTNCYNLTTASFSALQNISFYCFSRCYNLKSLYLMGSSLCKLSYSNAFSSTPIGGYSTSAGTYGSIYVPASLLTAYQTATNWTYFSSRFVGI